MNNIAQRFAAEVEVFQNRVSLLPEILACTQLSRPTIYRYWADPTSDFPRPIKLGPKRVAVRTAELNSWLANRPAARIGGAA